VVCFRFSIKTCLRYESRIEQRRVYTSRITITVPDELIDELLEVVKVKSKTEAIIYAIKDEIKQKKKKRIKNLAGKIDFDLEADELRHRD
jgi:hypothetical protein